MILHAVIAVVRFWYQFLRMIIAGVIQSCLVGWLEITVGYFFVCVHTIGLKTISPFPVPPFLCCYCKLTKLWMREQVSVGKAEVCAQTLSGSFLPLFTILSVPLLLQQHMFQTTASWCSWGLIGWEPYRPLTHPQWSACWGSWHWLLASLPGQLEVCICILRL